jgi:hypothetical protein
MRVFDLTDGLAAEGHDDLVQPFNGRFADCQTRPRKMLRDLDMRALEGLLKRTSHRVRARLTR